MIGATITQVLIEEQRKYPGATGDLTSVINDIVTACKAIAAAMRFGALSTQDILGTSDSENVQGERQKTLDIIANELFLRRTEFGGHVAGMASEEMETIYKLPEHYPTDGHYLLLYDPVDGSDNIPESAAIGTIFSILKRPEGASGHPGEDEFLQPGVRQVCAGYALYGSSAMIVITTGNGVNGFTLDPRVGEYIISHPNITIPEDCSRYFINHARSRYWDGDIARFIADCQKGSDGPLGRNFDQRWSGGAVPDIHRILMCGGVYLNPPDSNLREQGLEARLRLLYEVNPLAFLVEQAGGLASSGTGGRVLDIAPRALHQRCPAYMGSRNEVNLLLARYLGLDPVP